MQLHPLVNATYKETIIKSSPEFQLVLKQYSVPGSQDLYSIGLEHQTLVHNQVTDTAIYNFLMTSAERQRLADSLVAI